MKLVTKDVNPNRVEVFVQEVIVDEAGVQLDVVHDQVFLSTCVSEFHQGTLGYF